MNITVGQLPSGTDGQLFIMNRYVINIRIHQTNAPSVIERAELYSKGGGSPWRL